jgi:hypothetical protein
MKKFTKEMLKRFDNKIKAWRNPDEGKNKDEIELDKAYTQDRKDLRHCLSLLRKGKYSDSFQAMWDLDTVVRDQIPCDVYDLAEEYDMEKK